MSNDTSKNPSVEQSEITEKPIKKLPDLEGGTIEELPGSDLDDAAGGSWGAGSTTPTLVAVIHT